MALSERSLQMFRSKDGSALTSLRCHVCEETGNQFILWQDVQQAFGGVHYLEAVDEAIVSFTIDNDGELWRPLRLKHKPDVAYVIIYSHHQLNHSARSHRKHLEINSPLSANTHMNNKQVEERADNQIHSEAFPHLAKMYEFCTGLYHYLKTSDHLRMDYLKWYANARYYQSMVMKEFERLDQAGVRAHLDEKDQEQIFEEFRNVEKQWQEWDYQNISWNVLHCQKSKWDCAASLFIALPSNLDSWNDLDPLTHRFRLYFLCDNWKQDGTPDNISQHVHFSDHPGYDIKQSLEFFQTYGDYMLRVLQMVKRGYFGGLYEIPSLDTFKILWSCDPDIISKHVTKETLEPLVDKAIAYLQQLSPPKTLCEAPTHEQLNVIKSFLDVHEGDDGESNLNHYITSNQFVLWLCPFHMQQRYHQGALDDLKDFVLGRGGQIDMRHSTLRVELGSSDEADRFCSLLTATKYVFGITIKLSWKATRLYVKSLCLDIAEIGTVTLAIDGITLDIHPQGHVKYTNDLFSDEIMANDGLVCITLLNYPQPQQQRLHVRYFSLQSTLSQAPLTRGWLDMKEDVSKWCMLVRQMQEASDCIVVARKFHAVLEKHGLSDVSKMTIYTGLWDVVFDVKKCAFIELCAVDRSYPKAFFTAGTLLKVTLHIAYMEFDRELFLHIVQANAGLQEINIMYLRHNIHDHAEHIVRTWRASPRPFRLNLVERMDDGRGRVIAQLTFNEVGGERIQVLEWDCDHVFGTLSDYSASFLGTAIRKHPSALISFTLDVSRLSRVGLASVQSILSRSSLEHLNIVCTRFDPIMTESISQVLGSVQWPTLKSLAVFGDNINEWIQHWTSPSNARLLSLHIQGTGALQDLSHSSVLFIHRLIFASPLVELHIKNFQLKDKHDWLLLVESMDLVLLETLDLCERSVHQLISMGDTIDLFTSRLETVNRKGKRRIDPVLPSFTLDLASLSEQSFLSAYKFLGLCSVKELRINCAPFDLTWPKVIALILKVLDWPATETLELFGMNIDRWIHFLAEINIPHLKRLWIYGTEGSQPGLSHSSVLIVQRLIASSQLEEFATGAMLQDPQDWVLLVASMDFARVRFLLGDNHDQFMSNKEAVDLYNSKESGSGTSRD